MNKYQIIICILIIILAMLIINKKYNNYRIDKYTNSTQDSIKVYYNGFWPGFTSDNKFFTDLFILVFNKNIIEGTIDNADILVESVFGPSVLNHKNYKYTIFFTGESEINRPILNKDKYTCVLGGVSSKNNIICPLYIYFTYIDMNYHYSFPIKSLEMSKPLNKKNGILIIISNINGKERNACINKLEQANIPLFFGGKYKNNIGGPIDAPHGSPEFLKIISEYKFYLSMENSSEEYYITEKILYGFMADTIPIYWGSKNIHKFFNKNRFINVDNIDSDDWVNKIITLQNDDDLYISMLNENIYPNEYNTSIVTINTVAEEIKQKIFKLESM